MIRRIITAGETPSAIPTRSNQIQMILIGSDGWSAYHDEIRKMRLAVTFDLGLGVVELCG